MKRLAAYATGILTLAAVLLWPGHATGSPLAADAAPVTMTCSRPVLDLFTGQPIFIGGLPWYAEAGETVQSHPWGTQDRYEFGGKRYHYIGGVVGPNRAFLVEDCQQPQASPAAPPAASSVTQLAPGFYVVEDTGYTTMFIVTSDGVIAGDPNGPARAARLKAAIESVTSLPVRYVVYSHHDADHASGAGIFRDTATYVSHVNAVAPMAARNDPNTPPATVTFEDRMTLSLGGTAVELSYPGWNHSHSSLVLHYPAGRILWAVDFIPINRLPFGTRSMDYLADWIQSLRRVEAMDFDTLVPGHGSPGAKGWVRTVREYFGDLIAAVEDAERRGMAPNSPQMIGAVRATLYPKYGTWEQFGPWLPDNIKGLYEYWAREGRFTVR